MTGCTVFGGKQRIVAADTPCSALVPETWLDGVDGAPEPAPAGPEPGTLQGKLDQAIAELKKWIGFAVDTDNRRVQANARTRDSVGIISRCENRDAAAVKAAQPKVLGVF